MELNADFPGAPSSTPTGYPGSNRRWPGSNAACWIGSAMRSPEPHLLFGHRPVLMHEPARFG